MFRIAPIFLALIAFASAANSTEFMKETTLSWLSVQDIRPAQPSTQNSILINLSTSPWILHSGGGGASCQQDAAALPPENAMMKSVALTAIANNALVQVIVDNTLPLIAGYCQITVLSIKGQ